MNKSSVKAIEIRDQIERMDIAALVPYARNSRTHSDEQVRQIAESMIEWGWTNPILVDEDGGIIAGHGRVLAAQSLGMFEVPVIVAAGWSEVQKQAYVIADNKLALNSGWDADILKMELFNLRDADFDMGLIGFDAEELADLLGDNAGTSGLTDDDDAPPVPVDPLTRLGDVWVMGKHRVMCGDSTSLDAMERLMGGGGLLADVLITDPPYNVAYKGRTKDALEIENDSMSGSQFRKFLKDAFTAALSVMKPGAVFYIWHADLESYNFRGACQDVGMKIRQCLVWKKQTLVLGRQDYHWKHEPCLYGWKDGAGHLWSADRKQTTILEFDRPMRNAEHPTMKPVALFEYQLLNNTKGGDVVLDGFGGSGTTVIAAEKNGRVARVMELDPRYCDVIVQRWQEFTGRKAVLESTGETWADVQTGVKYEQL